MYTLFLNLVDLFDLINIENVFPASFFFFFQKTPNGTFSFQTTQLPKHAFTRVGHLGASLFLIVNFQHCSLKLIVHHRTGEGITYNTESDEEHSCIINTLFAVG